MTRPGGPSILIGSVLLVCAMLAGPLVPAHAADTYEPDDNPALARAIVPDGATQTHEIQPSSDQDYLRFSVNAGTEYIIETFPTTTNPVGDTVVTLYDSNGVTVISEDDDGGDGLYSRLQYAAPTSGTRYVRVRSYGGEHSGGYIVSVSTTSSAVLGGTITVSYTHLRAHET